MTEKLRKAFDAVEATEQMKENTAAFLADYREKRQAGPRRRPLRYAAAALACCLLFLSGAWAHWFFTVPVSYVSIDVNPSVELALNRLDRIVSATAYNDDGRLVLEGLPLKGRLYTEAIELLLESAPMQAYLTDSSALTFTVAAEAQEKETSLLAGIENTPGCRRYGGEGCGAAVSSLEEAHHYGLSFGKYAAYLVLSSYDDTVTPEDCRGMTMAQLREQTRQHQCAENDASAPGYGAHNGNGNGSGSVNGNGYGNGNGAGHTDNCDDPGGPNCDSGSGHHGNGNGNGYGSGNGSGHSESCAAPAPSDREAGSEAPEDCDNDPGPAEDCGPAGSWENSGGHETESEHNGSHNGPGGHKYGGSGHHGS